MNRQPDSRIDTYAIPCTGGGMTDQHRATPEQWAMLEEQSAPEYDSTILELRDRVEALEAAQQKIRSGPESPLVERVADAIAAQATSAGIVNDRPARAAILEVAAWFRTERDSPETAAALEQEANR
jgi:hypothetical protein